LIHYLILKPFSRFIKYKTNYRQKQRRALNDEKVLLSKAFGRYRWMYYEISAEEKIEKPHPNQVE